MAYEFAPKKCWQPSQQNGKLFDFLNHYKQSCVKESKHVLLTARTDMPKTPGRKCGVSSTDRRRSPKLVINKRAKRLYPQSRSQYANATCRNIVGRNILLAFGHRVAICCDMLGVVGSSLKMVKFEPTTTNKSQHMAPRWPNARYMLHPTMLWHVALACCDRLAGAQGALTSVYNVNKRSNQPLFWIFNTRARSSCARSGTEITEITRSLLGDLIKWQGMKLKYWRSEFRFTSRGNLHRNLPKITLWEEEGLG